jgi:hypothetical protein
VGAPPVRGYGEYVADLDVTVGDDYPVDEELGQPPLLEGGSGQPGPDGLAEAIDPVSDSGKFQPLFGRGVQLSLLSQEAAWRQSSSWRLRSSSDSPTTSAR